MPATAPPGSSHTGAFERGLTPLLPPLRAVGSGTSCSTRPGGKSTLRATSTCSRCTPASAASRTWAPTSACAWPLTGSPTVGLQGRRAGVPRRAPPAAGRPPPAAHRTPVVVTPSCCGPSSTSRCRPRSAPGPPSSTSSPPAPPWQAAPMHAPPNRAALSSCRPEPVHRHRGRQHLCWPGRGGLCERQLLLQVRPPAGLQLRACAGLAAQRRSHSLAAARPVTCASALALEQAASAAAAGASPPSRRRHPPAWRGPVLAARRTDLRCRCAAG
jgi:hypothetical protein